MTEVVIYTTQRCAQCRPAKEYLVARGIRYTERDVTMDEAAAEELALAGIMSVPAFKINGEFITGFDRNRLEELLNVP